MNNDNPNNMPHEVKSGVMKKIFIAAVVILVVLALCWYFLVPLLGITIAVSAGAWGLLVASVIAFCVAALLFFLIPGIIILLVCIFAFIWLLVAVILFPIFFPVLLPLFILLLVLAVLRRKKA